MNLDFEPERFRRLLAQASEQVLSLHASLPRSRVTHASSPRTVAEPFLGILPETGMEPEAVIQDFIPFIFEHSTLNLSPRFFAYIMSGGSQVGVLADLLCAGLNVNSAKWHLASAAAEVERTAVRWLGEFIGYRSGPGGALVSGGSEANLYGLRVARDVHAPDVREQGLAGSRPLTLYASEETHSCITKSVEMLGLGSSHLRKVPVHADFRVDVDRLEQAVRRDANAGLKPFCIVGNAGTVNTGAVDDLEALADVAERHGLWFHVDGAYGAAAARVEGVRGRFKGLERADSVALDPHKWLQVPFEAGCALIRDWDGLRRAFTYSAAYLQARSDSEERWDWMGHTFQLSRAFRALKVWMQLQVYGSGKLRAVIADNLQLMQQLGAEVDAACDFERLAPVSLSILCFRYVPSVGRRWDEASLDMLNARLLEECERRGQFFLTGTRLRGRTALRACLVNHRTTAAETHGLLAHLRSVGEELAASWEGGA
ncbi:pyridoxal-dependent decarboxylase [Pyxidicoccus fallax]|uniref:Pyridoxal-dependent decarboxylase n=1 Tax=Pyxidicoccus fallax TaxID=394095 RepID=A0A848LGN5_9BACT|nr:pyridoxal-dependent decarboxylase [Pyxidicoccus fallax]NMO16793.1 pyridoxal-dependent decarboxylase [Pyxidicoccus fallax]NPC78403.1 pyridoxal-dependent decarboxylase [Pyxidicoccus fallax]